MKRALTILLLSLIGFAAFPQSDALPDDLRQVVEKERYLRVMFYNCENYFDVDDDPEKNDDEFTPDGEKHWTKQRFYTKRAQIAKVIAAVGGWTSPDIIGLCEVESRYAVESLVNSSNLRRFEYKFLHKESPDSRGIDVVMLYQPKRFKPFSVTYIPVYVNKNGRGTRDIIMASGTTIHGDTLHVFVNHWPSRWGGQTETDELRREVAKIVRSKVDSLQADNQRAAILIMGDLNDYPDNNSVCVELQAQTDFSTIEQSRLYNLAYYMQFVKGWGTHKYDGTWGILDQMIISGSLLDGQGALYTDKDDARVFNPPFLLEADDTNVGFKPYRTYAGYKYLGGYSDHLPVFLNIYRKK